MITVAEVLSSIIMESPFLEEAIAEGLINLSALARKVQKRIEKALMKPVSESAILMALKRLSPKVEGKMKLNEKTLCQLGDLMVRSDLTEFTFGRSSTILDCQHEFLNAIRGRIEPFVTFTQGVYETTAIVNADLGDTLEDIFAGERLIASEADLSAITIRLAPESIYTPGVHYSILKQLAWHDINVVEVVSTYTEFSIILQKAQVDTSFSVLMRFLSRKKN